MRFRKQSPLTRKDNRAYQRPLERRRPVGDHHLRRGEARTLTDADQQLTYEQRPYAETGGIGHEQVEDSAGENGKCGDDLRAEALRRVPAEDLRRQVSPVEGREHLAAGRRVPNVVAVLKVAGNRWRLKNFAIANIRPRSITVPYFLYGPEVLIRQHGMTLKGR